MASAAQPARQTGEYNVSLLQGATGYPPVGGTIQISRGSAVEATYQLCYDVPPKPYVTQGISLMGIIREGAKSPGLFNQIIVKLPYLGTPPRRPPKDRLISYAADLELEWDALIRLSRSPDPCPVPKPIAYQSKLKLKVNGEIWRVPCLIREFLPGMSLRSWCDTFVCGGSPFKGLDDPNRWFTVARQLILQVHRIHLQRAAHGYICPDNIIVGEPCDTETIDLRFINFEQHNPDPTFIADPEELEAGLCVRRLYDSPDKIYRNYSHPVTEQEVFTRFVPGDIFSMGLTLLYLAVGEEPLIREEEPLSPFDRETQWHTDKGPWRKIENNQLLRSHVRFKEQLLSALRQKFSGQERVVSSMAEVIFACLRVESDRRFESAWAVLRILNQFHDGKTLEEVPRITGEDAVRDAVEALSNAIADRPQIKGTLIPRLYKRRLTLLTQPLFDHEAPDRYTVSRSREEIVDTLVSLFLMVGEGWRCKALTTASFWSDENCGAFGRVLSALKLAAESHCAIQWLLLLSEERLHDPRVVLVMEKHLSVKQSIKDKRDYDVCWSVKGIQEYRKVLQDRETFLFLEGPSNSTDKPIIVIPDHESDKGRIIALRCWPYLDETKEPSERWKPLVKGTWDREWNWRLELDRYPHKR